MSKIISVSLRELLGEICWSEHEEDQHIEMEEDVKKVKKVRD